MEHIKLNENEMAVLKGAKSSSDGNNGDFGFASDIEIEGLNRHQVAGYIGALVAKDLLRVYDQGTSRECFELQDKAGLRGQAILLQTTVVLGQVRKIAQQSGSGLKTSLENSIVQRLGTDQRIKEQE